MKKLVALLLVICMFVTLVACFSADDVRGDITDGSSSSVSEANEPEFSMGKVTGKKYENKFLGIGCNLDAEWNFYTDEQIKQANNIVSDAVGDELASMLENAEVIYDMMATHSNGSDSMNINLENMGLLGGAVDPRTRLTNSIPMIKQALENIGLSNIQTQNVVITIDGKEFVGLDIVAEISGMNFYERVFCIKKGEYMASVTFASFNKATIEAMTGYFYLIK